jgi:hypothetical protein
MTVIPACALARRTDTMPIVDHTGHIVERLAQLASRLDQVVQLTEEIIDS